MYSHMRILFFIVVLIVCPFLQMPRAVIQHKRTYGHLITNELLGWFMRKLGVVDNAWVLIVTPDNSCELAAQMVIRGPLPVNVCLGLSTLTNMAADMLVVERLAINNLIPAIKEADALPNAMWILALTLFIVQYFLSSKGEWYLALLLFAYANDFLRVLICIIRTRNVNPIPLVRQ